MHLLLLNHAYDTQYSTPDALLTRYTSLTGWAEALAVRGWRVTVLQRHRTTAHLTRRGVDYEFIADHHHPFLKIWELPTALHRRTAAIAPDVVHFNGLLFPLALRDVAQRLPKTPILVQHHAERPHRGWRHWLQRVGLAKATGFFFVSQAQAQMFRRVRLIRADQPVFEVMEGSTTFRPQPRDHSRHATGLLGNPLFLWIGRLIALKNPLVVLAGFARLLASHPSARLAMIYHDAPLLAEVQAFIAQHPPLQRAVTLVGAVPHAMIETYLSSADYFVLGSEYEGSGYALAEAMACGVIPLVTDIPSFRKMTNGGEVGALWQVGSADSMVAAAQDLLKRERRDESIRVWTLFQQQMSYAAIGRDADAAYRTVLTARQAA